MGTNVSELHDNSMATKLDLFSVGGLYHSAECLIQSEEVLHLIQSEEVLHKQHLSFLMALSKIWLPLKMAHEHELKTVKTTLLIEAEWRLYASVS